MPQTTEDILAAIESDNIAIISDMLKNLITTHKLNEGGEQKQLYERYKQSVEGVPVLTKDYENWEKVHKFLPNDFYGDIVDLKTGYMGNAIIIEVDKDAEGRDAQMDFLIAFGKEENTTDQNSELVKTAAISGKSYRLLFVREGEAKIMNLEPWETVVYYDASMLMPEAAMRYFTIEEQEGDGMQRRHRVEWYDDKMITYYRESTGGDYVKDTSQPREGDFAGTGEQPHFFDGVPVVEFLNNKEGLAEPRKAINLIDAYDDIMSSAASEVEQLRMSYMWLRGMGMVVDPELEDQMKQTGILPIPEGGDAGFIGKDLGGAAGFVETIMGEIRRNIYSFSKSIDLSNDMGGDMRVIGWQVALLRLEMSSQVTERKFTKSYRDQYRMLTTFWAGNDRTDIDPLTLGYVFTRKFPKDVDMEIDTLVKGMGVLPLETVYSLMSFIENPKELAEKFLVERPEMASIDQALTDAESSLE